MSQFTGGDGTMPDMSQFMGGMGNMGSTDGPQINEVD
jgi:hypothetical protein